MKRGSTHLRRELRQLKAQVAQQQAAIEADRQAAHSNEVDARWRQRGVVTALESTAPPEYVDPYLWRTDAYGHEMAFAAVNDRRDDGKNAPFIENEQDLALVRGMARFVTQAQPPGVGIVANLTNYTIGTGFKFTVATKNKREAPPGLIAAVQDVVDQFLDDNDWTGDLDRELFGRWRVDGEFFLALHPQQQSGRVLCRVVEPEQICDPHSGISDDWITERLGYPVPCATSFSFGVHTAEHDIQTVYGYAAKWDAEATYDYLPATWIEHAKCNVPRNVKRGLSDFYSAWAWLNDQEKLLRNTARGAAIQAAIAFIRQHTTGATQTQVENFRGAIATGSYQRSTVNGGTRTTYQTNYGPGTILDIPKGQEYQAGPMGAERGEAFISVIQSVLRHVGTRWAMPEYMVSGDGSNANYASTLVAESPFVKNVQAMQAGFENRCHRILWKAVEHAATCQRFARFNLPWCQIEKLIEIQIEPPQVETRDPNAETDRRIKLHEAKVLSSQTLAAQEGLDYEIEQANWAGTGGATAQLGAATTQTGVGGNLAAAQGNAPGGVGAGGVASGATSIPTSSIAPDVQGQALNGAQISSMVDIIAKAKSGEIPAAAVRPLIVASFPSVAAEVVDAIVAALDGVGAAGGATGAVAGATGGDASGDSTDPSTPTSGEFKGINSRDLSKLMRNIDRLIDSVKMGEKSREYAIDLLVAMGLDNARATRIVDNALASTGPIENAADPATLESLHVREADDSGGRWVTSRGRAIYIGADGKPTTPPAKQGKTANNSLANFFDDDEPDSTGGSDSSSSGKSQSKPPSDSLANFFDEPAGDSTPSPTFGKSSDVKIESSTKPKAMDRTLKSVFGKDSTITTNDIPSAVGAPDGAKVVMDAGQFEDHVAVQVQSKDGWVANRKFVMGSDGKPYIENESFYLPKKLQGQGIGTQVFARQVENASAMGVDNIRTVAARGEDTNGYYTWARLGYDGEISDGIRAKAPEAFAGAKRVSDLMRTKEGRDAWKEHGDTMSMKFDLNENSQSRRVLAAYLKEKGMKGASESLMEMLVEGDAEMPAADDDSSTPRNVEQAPEMTEVDEDILDRIWDEIGKQNNVSESHGKNSTPSLGCLMAVVDGHIAREVRAFADSIPDSELAPDGRENDPHITVKYGIHNPAGDVVEEMGGWKAFEVKIGEVSLFKNPEYDVVKFDVQSDALTALNRQACDSLDCTDSHPVYHPHLTIAYLKPGEGEKYVGPNALTGKTILVRRMVFSDAENKETEIPYKPTYRGSAETPESKAAGPSWLVNGYPYP